MPKAGKGRSGFGGLLLEFANRLTTLSHGAALQAVFAFPFLVDVDDLVFFPLVDGKPRSTVLVIFILSRVQK